MLKICTSQQKGSVDNDFWKIRSNSVQLQMVYGSLRNREMKSNAGKICQSLIWNELIFHSLIGGTTKWITKKIKSAAVRLVLFFYAFYMLKYRFLLFPWYICLGDIGNIKRIYKWMQSWCVGTERVGAAFFVLEKQKLAKLWTVNYN